MSGSTKIARRRRALGLVAGGTALALVMFGLINSAIDAMPDLPECTTEDSVVDCYWDSETGRDFEVRDGVIYFEDGASVPICTEAIKDAEGICFE